MPTGPRIRDNGAFGNVSDNPLTSGATTFNSPELIRLGPVSGGHAVMTLDPLYEFGDPEIVIVTAHTSMATVATIQRGAYGTTARSHPQGTLWVHAAVDEDHTEVVTTSTLPADPYRGQLVFNSDLDAVQARTIDDTWRNINLLANPPACQLFHSTSQSIAHNTIQAVAFDSEIYDTQTLHNTGFDNSRITPNTAGIYIFRAWVEWSSQTNYTELLLGFRVNGSGLFYFTHTRNPGTMAGTRHQMASAERLMNGSTDYMEAVVRQQNGSSAARDIVASVRFSAVWVGRV